MKKNNFKRIIATALAGLMVFGAAPAASFAGIKLPELNFASIKASAATVNDLTYETANGEITITG